MDIQKTKSGLNPSTTEMPYQVKTSDAERFIQKKISALSGAESNTKINLFAIEISKKFVPFMLFLPLSAADDGSSRSTEHGKDEPSIFTPDDSEGGSGVRLKKGIYTATVPYTYNNKDSEAFSSPDWRRNREVSYQSSGKLKYTRTPKIQSYGKGSKYITFLIDPLRLFHDMLSTGEPGEQDFRVSVRSVETIKSGEVVYTVIKSPIKGVSAGNMEEKVAAELNRRMKG